MCNVISFPRSDHRDRFDGDYVLIPQDSDFLSSHAATSIIIGDVTMKTTTIEPSSKAEELQVKQVPV